MLRAVALMAVAMSLIPGGDTAGKLMAVELGVPPFFIAWSRFLIGALVLLPFVGVHGLSPAVLLDWRVILRGLLIVGGICSILTALQTEGLATVFGAFFIGPIISYFLSAWLLGETITPLRTVLLLVGFAGVLLVVKPGFGMTAGTGFALLAGAFYGGYLVASRWLSGVAAPKVLLLSQLLVGAVVLAPFGVASMPPVSLPLAGLVLTSALCSMLGNLLLIHVYARAEASLMAPFVYFQLIAATLLGYLVFGDLPDSLALTGLGLLILSGFASLAAVPKKTSRRTT